MNTCPILVGREAEFRRLNAARVAGGGVVFISGEGGIGKSRLLREFAQTCTDQSVPVIWGRPEILSNPGPFSMIADFLQEAMSQIGANDEVEEILTTVEDGRGEPPPRQIAARIRGLLGTLTPGPIIIFEDLHEADEMSLAVLGHLMRPAADDGVLLIGTYRPESSAALDRVLGVAARDRLAEDLHLGPLDERGVAEMLRAMWERDATPSELEELTRLAEGSPFFTEELAAAEEGSIPESVARAVAARMARLSENGRQMIEVASLIGGAIDPDLISATTGIPETELPEQLVAAVRAGLLADRDGRLAFRHGLMREAVSRSLVSVQRADLHRRIARHIEQRVQLDGELSSATLVRHFREAGDTEDAAKWAVRAGRRALGVAALEEAFAHFDFARSQSSNIETQLLAREGLSEIASRTDPRDPAEWEELAVEYDRLNNKTAAARCWSKRGWVARWQLNNQQAAEFFERARLGLDEGAHRAEIAQLLIDTALAVTTEPGRASETESLLEEGLRLAQEMKRFDLSAEALSGLSLEKVRRGEMASGLEFGRQAREAALLSNDGKTIAHVIGQQAWSCLYAGEAAEALSILDEAEQWAARHVGGGVVSAVDAARAYTLFATGRPSEAAAAAARLGATPHVNGIGSLARLYAITQQSGDEDARDFLGAWWGVLGGQTHREYCLTRPQDALEESPQAYLACVGEFLLASPEDGGVQWWGTVLSRFREYYRPAAPTTRMDNLIAGGRAAWRIGSLDAMRLTLEAMEDCLREVPYPPFLAAAQLLRAQMLVSLKDVGAEEAAWRAVEMLWALGHVGPCVDATILALAATEDVLPDKVPLVRDVYTEAVAVGATLAAASLEGSLRRLGVRVRAGRPRGRPRTPKDELSVREQEVAVLIAAGATNAEVARRLVLSERTVEDHVARAQKRLGVTGRAGLAAWAAKQGLV